MGSVPIVHVGPFGQVGFTLLGGGVGAGIGPFPEGGLDEPFGLAIGFGRVGFGSDVFQFQGLAGCGKSLRLVARSVRRENDPPGSFTDPSNSVITRVTVTPRL